MQLLTASRLKLFRRCQRQHHYRYILGVRPREDAEALRFGTLWHRGLEAWFCGIRDGAGSPLDEALAAIAGAGADPYEQARLEVLLAGYDARWCDAGLEPLAVEVEFRAPLVNPETGAPSRTFELAGKIDAVVLEHASGRHLIVEHKTSSADITAGSPYWAQLRLDGQVSQYFAGARALGYQPAACLYDVVQKPAQRPSAIPIVEDGAKVVLDAAGQRVRTKDGKKWRETGDAAAGYVLQTRQETPDEYRARLGEAVAAEPDKYFARGEVVRLEDDEAEHGVDVWQQAQAMREGERLGRAPRNADACNAYNRLCPYFPVCTNAGTLDDARFEKLDDPHSELAATAG